MNGNSKRLHQRMTHTCQGVDSFSERPHATIEALTERLPRYLVAYPLFAAL